MLNALIYNRLLYYHCNECILRHLFERPVKISTSQSGSGAFKAVILKNAFFIHYGLALPVRKYLVHVPSMKPTPLMTSKTVDSTNFIFGRPLGLSMRGKKPVKVMI